jgi:hypothetical protein
MEYEQPTCLKSKGTYSPNQLTKEGQIFTVRDFHLGLAGFTIYTEEEIEGSHSHSFQMPISTITAESALLFLCTTIRKKSKVWIKYTPNSSSTTHQQFELINWQHCV